MEMSTFRLTSLTLNTRRNVRKQISPQRVTSACMHACVRVSRVERNMSHRMLDSRVKGRCFVIRTLTDFNQSVSRHDKSDFVNREIRFRGHRIAWRLHSTAFSLQTSLTFPQWHRYQEIQCNQQPSSLFKSRVEIKPILWTSPAVRMSRLPCASRVESTNTKV